MNIKIVCEDNNPRSGYDKIIKEIVMEKETQDSFFGVSVANSACLLLEWPKFAWKRVTDVTDKRLSQEVFDFVD